MNPALPCVELLPPRPSYMPGAALRWCPVGAVLELDTHRTRPARVYTLSPIAVDPCFHGRAWCCRKAAGTAGTDPTEDHYTVFLSDGVRELDQCDCKGYSAHGHCCHLDAVRAIDANGWFHLPTRPADPPYTADELDDMAAGQPHEESGLWFPAADDGEASQAYAEAMHAAATTEAADQRAREAMSLPECFAGVGSGESDRVPF